MAWNYNAPETQAAFSDYRQQRQETTEKPGLLQQGLEALGRPQRGVFGAIESGLRGQNPLEGFARGFTGSPEEYDPASRLEAAGMGTLPVGPFDTRGLLGFGLGIATDPLTYLPGPGTVLKGARYAGLLGRGAQAAERTARAAEAASRAGQVARPAAALLPSIEEGMRTGYQPGLARDVTQAVAKKVPGVKNFLRWTVPRTITDTPVDRALQEADTTADRVARRVELVFMPKLRANPIVSRIDEEGRITGTHGPAVGVFWGDVAQNPGKFADELDLKPKDLEFFQNYKDIWNELRPEYEKVYEEFKKVSPEGSNKYTLTNVHLQEGDDFISRIAEVDGKIDWKPKARPIGPERGVQKPRGVFTGEQGIEAGVDWVTDPLEVASTRITDILAKIGEMQYGIAMAGQAKHVMGFGGYEGMRAISAAHAEKRVNLRKLQSVLSRISRGETVPSVTLEPLRAEFPEIMDAATRMMSQTAVPPVATPLGRAGGAFKGLVEEPLPSGLTKPKVIGEIQKLDPTRKVTELRRLPRSELDTVLSDLRTVGEEALPPPPPSGAAAFTPPRGPLEVRTVPQYKNIKELQAQAQDLLDVQTDAYKSSRESYKAARAGEMGDIASQGLQEVSRVPMLGGQLFEPEVAARLESHFGAQAMPNEILQRAGELSSFARGTQSGYDFGGPALQGLVTLATHPLEWFRGVGKMFEFFKDPQDYQRWLARPEVNEFFRRHPDLMGSSRYQFETLERGQLGEKLLRKAGGLPGPLGQAGRGAENVTGRFQAAYEGPLAYMRYEVGKALEPHFVGKERDLDNLVNHMTGVLSAKSLGQGTNQRNVESLMFYSSQYLRASLALVGDMFSPNQATRDEAMNGIWSLLKVGHLAYDHVSQALGQDPIYDPKDGRFFTWDIGGTRVGVGSNWIALLRLFGRALEDPTSFVNINDVPDNPLVKFVRGRTSPIVSELADLVTNETFTGEPVTNVGEAAKVTGERLLPFGITAGVEGARGAGGLPAGPTELVASMAGLRGFPAGLKDIRNDVSREMFGGDYTDLDPIQKAQVAADPRIKTQEIPPGQRFADERRQREIQEQYGGQLERVATQVNQGTVDKKDFREAVNQARLVRNIQREQIPQKERTGPRAQADIDRDKYFALLREKDEFGRTNFDAADEFLASLPATSQEIIKAAEQASLEGLGPQAQALMRELSDTRKKLEPYWEVRTTVLEHAGLWDQWLDATPHQRRVIEAAPRYKAAEKIWDKRREAMRLSRPDLDKALVAWGFATKTMAEQAAAQAAKGGASPFAIKGFSTPKF